MLFTEDRQRPDHQAPHPGTGLPAPDRRRAASSPGRVSGERHGEPDPPMMPGRVLDMHARLREACRGPNRPVRFMDAHVRTSLLNAAPDRTRSRDIPVRRRRVGPPVPRFAQGPVHRDHVPGRRRNAGVVHATYANGRAAMPAHAEGLPNGGSPGSTRRCASPRQGRRRRWPPHRDQRRHVGVCTWRSACTCRRRNTPATRDRKACAYPRRARKRARRAGGTAEPPGDRPAVDARRTDRPLPAPAAPGEPPSHPASTAKEYRDGRP